MEKQFTIIHIPERFGVTNPLQFELVPSPNPNPNLSQFPFQASEFGFLPNPVSCSVFNGGFPTRPMVPSFPNGTKTPKSEPVEEEWPNTSPTSMNLYNNNNNNTSYLQLPLLETHEEEDILPPPKRPRNQPLTLPSGPSPLPPSRSFVWKPLINVRPSVRVPSNQIARQRRKNISEKTLCLRKLMPWEKKMDMATLLSEAYKYVKFLQAQVSVLQSMPVVSEMVAQNTFRDVTGFGGLEKLNRQQLLEVLVNSPEVQSMWYNQGCCVYSLEQILMFKKITESLLLLGCSETDENRNAA